MGFLFLNMQHTNHGLQHKWIDWSSSIWLSQWFKIFIIY